MARYGWLALVVSLGLLVAVSGVGAAGATAAGTTSHSGRVAAIDPHEGVLILDEVGPWQVQRSQTIVTRRTLTLTPATKFNTFIRVNVPGGFAGDFLEVALEAGDLTPGDFVTAECVTERGRLVAMRVTLAELN